MAEDRPQRKRRLKIGGRFDKPIKVGGHTYIVKRKRSDDFTMERIDCRECSLPDRPTAVDNPSQDSQK